MFNVDTSVEPCESHGSTPAGNIPRPPSGSIGSIINQFKSACTKRIHAAGHYDFAWQSRFHNRVIRNPDEGIRIRRYIQNNPSAWETDDLYMAQHLDV